MLSLRRWRDAGKRLPSISLATPELFSRDPVPGRASKSRLLLAGRTRRRSSHRPLYLVGSSEGEVFRSEFRRQDFHHRFVLDPDLHHVEGTAVAAEALPALTLCDLFDSVRLSGDAEREMRRTVGPLGCRLLDKTAAAVAGWPKLGPGRIDLDTRSVFVALKREETPRIGREWHRNSAHEFGQDPGDILWVAGSDG